MTTKETIEHRQRRVHEIATRLFALGASADTYEILAANLEALLKELADAVSGFPNGALLRPGVQALADHARMVADHALRTGASARAALLKRARELGATFGNGAP